MWQAMFSDLGPFYDGSGADAAVARAALSMRCVV
jgi:hypothetical protein